MEIFWKYLNVVTNPSPNQVQGTLVPKRDYGLLLTVSVRNRPNPRFKLMFPDIDNAILSLEQCLELI